MTSVGEFLVRDANKRGIVVLWVHTDGRLVYYPPKVMEAPKNQGFLRLINRYYHRVKQWLAAEAASGGEGDDS